MTDHISPSSEVERLREAGDWIAQLAEPHDPTVFDRWLAWCSRDPQNVVAFQRMQEVWEGFGDTNPQERFALRRGHRSPRRAAWLSAAAGVLIILGIAAVLLPGLSQHVELRTAAGQRRSEVLADGTRVDLAPNSQVSVRFAPLRREVHLDRGQAFFAVAPSRWRSFVVDAHDLTATAMGTAFDVRIDGGDSIVTVSAGLVRVATRQGAQTVAAAEGQRVTYSASARGLSSTTIDPVAAESWRHGVLPFVGETLEDVVLEVNRYSARKIDIAPDSSDMRFTGTVSLGHVEDWLNALPQIFSVEVIDRGNNAIHIRSRGSDDLG